MQMIIWHWQTKSCTRKQACKILNKKIMIIEDAGSLLFPGGVELAEHILVACWGSAQHLGVWNVKTFILNIVCAEVWEASPVRGILEGCLKYLLLSQCTNCKGKPSACSKFWKRAEVWGRKSWTGAFFCLRNTWLRVVCAMLFPVFGCQPWSFLPESQPPWAGQMSDLTVS